MLEKILRGKLRAVAGEARVIRKKALYVPDIHDYREFLSKQLSPEEAANLEWRTCDADHAFSALLQFGSSLSGSEETIPVFVRVNLFAPAPASINGWYFYGDKGTLVGEGLFSLSVSKHLGSEVEPLPTPPRLLAELPQVGDDAQKKWTALARDFVADILDRPHEPYLTFQDGWRYQVAIDAIRQGKGWYQMPEPKEVA
jgi:predicted dehydrogenase